MNPVQYYAEYI